VRTSGVVERGVGKAGNAVKAERCGYIFFLEGARIGASGLQVASGEAPFVRTDILTRALGIRVRAMAWSSIVGGGHFAGSNASTCC
jgi:hypothetical protein